MHEELVSLQSTKFSPTALNVCVCCKFQSDVNPNLPLLIFGAMALIGGALVFVLPETRDQPMRQTVEEGEEFIRQNMCQFGPCKR